MFPALIIVRESRPKAPYAMDDSAKGDALKTHSRVRAWWLTRFRGYDLEHLEESPDAISFGRIVYKRTWWLKPKNKK